MYYGYPIRTRYGWVPAYDNELNLPASLPRGMMVSLHQPSDALKSSGRAIVVYPVGGSPEVITYDGERITVAEMKALEGRVINYTQNGTPVIIGPVIPIQNLGPKQIVQPICIDIPGHSPGLLAAVVICIVAAFIFATITNIMWAQVEKAKYEAHKYDVVAQSQEISNEWVDDLNGDGVPDIRSIVWKNGEYIQAAISEYGYQVLGGTVQTVNEGLDWNELADEIENEEAEKSMWEGITTVITVAVAGGAIFLILRYGLPAILPPRAERPPAYLPFERVYTPPTPAAAGPPTAAAPPLETPAPA